MADAYTYQVKPNTIDSHQISPSYVLTFLRWAKRDTKNFDSPADFKELRRPLIVVNDCIALTTNNSKKSLTKTVNMTLRAGDINYSTALAPGDFLFVNMVNDEGKARDIKQRAAALKPINKFNDGFKGIYKVKSVRRQLETDPSSGAKSFTFNVQAVGFTEFNQTIYFNQLALDKGEVEGLNSILLSKAAEEINTLKKKDAFLNLGISFKVLISMLIGEGFPSKFVPNKGGEVRNHNKNFIMPPTVGLLLGLGNVQRAADIFTYFLGIEKYSNGNSGIDPSKGLTPSNTKRKGTFLETNKELSGATHLKPNFFGQKTAWSILSQYTNPLINELFTTYKITPEGLVLPCVVFRQIPKSSPKFKEEHSEIENTQFLNLPRWEISPDLVYSYNIGRDEATRVNFVQIFGNSGVDTSIGGLPQYATRLAIEGAIKNYVVDADDIKRNGLKPIIQMSNFDYPIGAGGKHLMRSTEWAKLVFDWNNNGHLRESGVIVSAGIEEPISVGDNIVIDDTLFHIESITHKMVVNPAGAKSFITQMTFSYGTSIRDNSKSPVYPEMDYVQSEDRRADDWKNGDKVYPGVSDEQDVFSSFIDNSNSTKTKERKTYNETKKPNKK